ncbi:MAG: TPM domain-containing protein [Bacteroidetes bacterium]|nr:TPM domain-containing protein [Bacteroidota bacterium]
MSNELLYHFFDDDDFLLISDKIKETEKITAGEIRVAIKENKTFANRNKSLKELAEQEFYKLGMNDTRDKTGILLYILLEQRKFYILADEGIHKKVEQKIWDNIASEMQNDFRLGHYSEGVVNTIEKVGQILGEHFPVKIDDTNELSNKVVL